MRKLPKTLKTLDAAAARNVTRELLAYLSGPLKDEFGLGTATVVKRTTAVGDFALILETVYRGNIRQAH
ncbi:hypothetical protein HDU86_001492, partial [Geranomyces michiganensis]